jgi:hypothetical protein
MMYGACAAAAAAGQLRTGQAAALLTALAQLGVRPHSDWVCDVLQVCGWWVIAVAHREPCSCPMLPTHHVYCRSGVHAYCIGA